MFDGGEDIHSAFELSGEPISRQISCNYGTLRSEQKNACEIAATNVAKRVYQKDYMDFWNRTAFETATGKPVDAVIMPLAPCAAARPGRYDYHG
jgi:amidase